MKLAPLLLMLCGCLPATVAKDAPQSLSSFRIAAAHVAIERPKLPDTLKGKTDENDSGSVADERPLCVLYRERWMEIADCDEIDGFRVVVKGSDAIPEQIKQRRLRLPIVHWDEGGKYFSGEYRGADEFDRMRMRVRSEPQQVGYAKQWTYPGDIWSHLRDGHHQDATGMTQAEAEREHDRLHNERARAVSGNCPGGVCPVRRRR